VTNDLHPFFRLGGAAWPALTTRPIIGTTRDLTAIRQHTTETIQARVEEVEAVLDAPRSGLSSRRLAYRRHLIALRLVLLER
jgi:hypothetical protein